MSINEIEEARLSRHHIKIMLISGISFFTDAYDLFIIGIILVMIKAIFPASTLSLGILASSALFGAVIGPMIFGYLGDKFGRKSIYWVTISVLAIAAIGSSLSTTLIELILWRLLLGIAIGGDYPLSSTIVAEYSNKANRGALVASTFAMQGFGIITGIALAIALLLGGVPYGLAWRLLLAFGAIPALIAIPVRKKLNETPWYKELTSQKPMRKERFATMASKRPKVLVGTALSWFLIDVTYYGTGIFTPYLTTLLGAKGIIAPIETTALLLLIFALPGYWIAVWLIDKEGRRAMQAIGFAAIAASFIIIGLYGGALIKMFPLLFFAIYGLSFFFSNYGPNTTTYVYPVELYPTEFRTRGHGFAATMGKLGATVSALFFPMLIDIMGKFSLIALLGGVALIGAIETIVLLPETKQKSLSLTSREFELHLITETLSNELMSLANHADKVAHLASEQFSAGREIDTNGFFKKVKKEEHNADLDVQKIYSIIISMSVNPSIYDDISLLARKLDDIIDTHEAFASRIMIYGISTSDQYMEKLSGLIVKCIGQIKAGLTALSELEGDKNLGKIENAHMLASRYENDADEMLRESLKHAATMGCKKMMEYKEIYEWMESATDIAVDVLDVIEDIGLRYIYER